MKNYYNGPEFKVVILKTADAITTSIETNETSGGNSNGGSPYDTPIIPIPRLPL